MSWGVEGLRRVMLRLSCTRVERRASPRVCTILQSIWYDTDEKMIAAVPLTHVNLATTMKNVVNTYHLSSADRTYLVMPLFHVHGLLAGLLAPLLSGGSVVVPPKFSAGTFWSEFISTGSTWYTVSILSTRY